MKKNNRERGSAKYTEHGALVRISKEVLGMVLPRAFVVAKSAGFKLKVNKLDGLPLCRSLPGEKNLIMVDVVSGLVKRSWFVEDVL